MLLVWGCSAPRDDDDTTPNPPSPSGGTGMAAAGAGNAGKTGGQGGASGSASMPNGGAGAAAGGKPATGGTSSTAGTAGAGGAGPALPPSGACDQPFTKLVDVKDASELAKALASSAAGTMIRLPDSEIRGAFKATTSGNAQQPIVLCGTRQAVLSTTGANTVLLVEGDYWILSGFSVTGGQKGILLDGAQHNLLTDLSVHGTGNEAVHFRSASSDNILEWSEVSDTGNESPEFGEAVYLGSAVSNWEKYTGSASTPDRSDRNIIRNNKLGPNVRAELIDVKEGTTGGVIRDNNFDGSGIADGGFADSWVDVKGNGYSIEGNEGMTSPADGFQVHVVEDGWGNNNAFQKNHAAVNASGYGFRISQGATGTVVGCNNTVTGAGAGLSNIGCKN